MKAPDKQGRDIVVGDWVIDKASVAVKVTAIEPCQQAYWLIGRRLDSKRSYGIFSDHVIRLDDYSARQLDHAATA